MSNTEVFASYEPISSKQLKETVSKGLRKWWEDKLKALQLEVIESDEGKLVTVDSLGTNFLAKEFISPTYNEEAVEYFTLGDLADSRGHEGEMVQFEVAVPKVESLLWDSKMGLLKNIKLVQLITIGYMPNDDSWIIVSGRHRLTALMTIAKYVDGWEEFKIPVYTQSFITRSDVARAIGAANSSRTMTPTEKKQVELAAAGRSIDITASLDENLTKACGMTSITRVSEINPFVWASGLAELGLEYSPHTLANIGRSFLSKFKKGLDDRLGKGESKLLLHTDSASNKMVYEVVTRAALTVTSQLWPQILEEIKQVKTDRSGNVKLDADGNPIVTMNVARSTGEIGEFVSNLLLEKLGDQLKAANDSRKAEEAAAKQAKQADKAEEAVIKKLKTLQDSLGILSSMEGNKELVDGMKLQIAELQAELQAMKAADNNRETPEEYEVVEVQPDNQVINSLLQ